MPRPAPPRGGDVPGGLRHTGHADPRRHAVAHYESVVEEREGVTAQGSRSVLETIDEHGATLRITAEGQIRIWEAAVEAAPCTPESLGIG